MPVNMLGMDPATIAQFGAADRNIQMQKLQALRMLSGMPRKIPMVMPDGRQFDIQEQHVPEFYRLGAKMLSDIALANQRIATTKKENAITQEIKPRSEAYQKSQNASANLSNARREEIPITRQRQQEIADASIKAKNTSRLLTDINRQLKQLDFNEREGYTDTWRTKGQKEALQRKYDDQINIVMKDIYDTDLDPEIRKESIRSYNKSVREGNTLFFWDTDWVDEPIPVDLSQIPTANGHPFTIDEVKEASKATGRSIESLVKELYMTAKEQ